MSFDYIKKHYGVSTKRGDRVEFTSGKRKREGVVASASHQINVRFDGTKHSVPVHPTDPGLRFLKETTDVQP